jgi:hypothetical protein
MRPSGLLSCLLLLQAALAVACCPASSDLIYVDCSAPGPEHDGTTWDTAYLTIQEGVGAATPDGEVWVADGVYVENVAMGEGVAIYGGFLGAEPGGYETDLGQRDFAAHPATIDGNRLKSCVVMAVGARVDGFAMTNGSAASGGGVCCEHLGESGVIANNLIRGNEASHGGGICGSWTSSPLILSNVIVGNQGNYAGGIYCSYDSSPTIVGNIVSGCTAAFYAGGIYCAWCAAAITNNTVVGNEAGWYGGGIVCYAKGNALVGNNIVSGNRTDGDGGGIWSDDTSFPSLSHNDFWGNAPNDYVGCEPGEGDISADPVFADLGEGDFHLKAGSPCIDAGSNSAPGLPETDWDSEDRVADGIVDIGADELVTWTATALDPQPEGDGALFGEPEGGYPGWVWFSIPMTPADSAAPPDVLGFSCSGKLFRYDKYAKAPQVYQPPFSDWPLAVGDSFLLWLDGAVPNPSYAGLSPYVPWTREFRLGRQGWTWVGMPGPVDLAGGDFMRSVRVKYPSDESGSCRTAQEDYGAIPDNWVAWGWPYWNTRLQAVEVFTPYAPFGHRTAYPWIGYRVWVRVGGATGEDDPDQVTLLWPRRVSPGRTLKTELAVLDRGEAGGTKRVERCR